MSTQTLKRNIDFKTTKAPKQKNKSKNQLNVKKKLLILSGATKGVSVDLEDGVYEIGSSDACDLIINDPLIMDRHLFMAVNHQTITVCPIGTEVFINGKHHTDLQTINFFDVITIGTTSFCLGFRHQTWPRIKKLKLASPNKTTDSLQTKSTPKTNTKAFEIFQKKQRQNNKFNQYTITITSFFGLILIIFSLGVLMPVQAVPKKMSVEKGVELLIDKEHLSHSLQIQYSANGELELSGYVQNTKAYKKLKSTMLNKYPTVKMRVWTVPELLAQAKKLLFSLRAEHVDVEFSNTGKLVVKGYVSNKADWAHIHQVLSADFPSVVTINDQHIYSLQEVTRSLSKKIIENKINQWVSISSESDKLKVEGAMPKEKYSIWEQTLVDFNSQMSFPVDIDNQVINAKEQVINIPIKSISIGNISYLTLKDNSRYIEGGSILDGYVLHKINLNHIVLMKNNIKYDYYTN